MADTTYGTINPDSLQFIFEYTKDTPAQQMASGERLDAKAVSIFSAASIVIGVAGLSAFRDLDAWLMWPLLLSASLTYLFIALITFQTVAPKEWRGNQHAVWLWKECYDMPPDDIRHSLVADLEEVTKHNEEILKYKSDRVSWSIPAVSAESVLVLSALLIAAA